MNGVDAHTTAPNAGPSDQSRLESAVDRLICGSQAIGSHIGLQVTEEDARPLHQRSQRSAAP